MAIKPGQRKRQFPGKVLILWVLRVLACCQFLDWFQDRWDGRVHAINKLDDIA